MLRSLNLYIKSKILLYNFSRSKPRRQRQIPLSGKLKDLTSSQMFQTQILQQRKLFQQQIPQKTLSQTLRQSRPKLNQRFKVDKKDMQKKIKKIIHKQMAVQRIVPGGQGQSFQTLQSKSHIYDEKAELQFQQKFRKQLFIKKQTNRMLQKQKNNYKNYLPNHNNDEYQQYQQNKIKLKNSRIQSMMNFKRNNEQLRLLIDSGYIDNPKNLNKIIGKMNQNKQVKKLQHHQQYSQNNPNFNNQIQNQSFNNNQSQYKQQSQSSLLLTQKKSQIAPEIQNLHSQMMQNIVGPQQLRNTKLLQQFFQKYQQNNQIEKQKARKDLQLIKKMKQYQTKKFQSRYQTINFRFKGQVDFTWMKQSQLLSYIKHQRTKNTQPQQLLSIFSQNKQKQNKFNQPIITPTVMSRIYSVCSLYQFPQTDNNNHLNLLNDTKFINLQKSLFKSLNKLPDDAFVDAVFGYSKNHKEQQGMLKIKMNQNICKTIFNQINQRVAALEEEDLGLLLRAVINTNILKMEQFNWGYIEQVLQQRLPNMQKDYQFQSVMSFITLLPVNQSNVSIVQSNIKKFKQYKWQAKQTLLSFLEVSSFIIRYKDILTSYKKIKHLQQIKHIICTKYQEIMSITQKISINNMPSLLSVLYCLDRVRPVENNLMLEIPNKLINKCKKEIIDNVRMQRQLIKKHTIGNIVNSIALIDYCKALIQSGQQSSNQLQVIQISTLKSLFSFRSLPFNSINYFTYHQLTKLINIQIHNIPIKHITQTIFSCSLVRYKNQGLIQQIMGKLVQKIHHQIKQSSLEQINIHKKYIKQYVMLICSFHHYRMVNQYYYQFVNIIRSIGAGIMVKLQPNLIIRLFQSIVSLSFTTNQNNVEDYQITKYFQQIYVFCVENNLLTCLQLLRKEELLTLHYFNSMMRFFNVKINKYNKKYNNNSKYQQFQSKINSALQKNRQFQQTIQQKFIISISKMMNKISDNINKSQNLNKNQNQNQLQNILNEFQKIQSKFYQMTIKQIMQQQQHIGSQYNYQKVYQKIKQKLKSQKQHKIIQKKWKLQLQNKRQVYFLATYQHLLAKYQQKNTSVKLFGIWKIYSEIYALKGWRFRLICTFLEG